LVVRVEKNESVITIINDRPEARNAGDPQTATDLTRAFLEFDADPTAKVAVFYGEGGSFCSGWDLKYAATLSEPEKFQTEIVEGLAFRKEEAATPRGPLGPSRLSLSKPVVGAIEGPAVAGGMELALWCDIRVMAETAYFGVYCRRWGIPLLDGGTVRLPRLVGTGRALEIILTGRKVPAEEALRIGLCEKVVGHGHARSAAEELARTIASFPQAAVKADRRNVYETYGLSVGNALRTEWKNGVSAHIEEGAAGAKRFSEGSGRHGSFESI
jgi:enoyl-CoA hydratase